MTFEDIVGQDHLKSFLQNNNSIKVLEIILLFICTPIVLFVSIPILYKLAFLFFGALYIVLISVFIEKFTKTKKESKTKDKTLQRIGVCFLIIALLTIVILYNQDKEALFNVMLNKPLLWLQFSGIYVLFSVIPQELIYRTFFVKRYRHLFKNELVFIIINSLLFSFAHLGFQSWIVLSFTFIGSLLFTLTYLKTKSTWLVIFEHSLYGVWLYTVGYGALFMFPI